MLAPVRLDQPAGLPLQPGLCFRFLLQHMVEHQHQPALHFIHHPGWRLQGLADAGDDTRRAKGRRGLETLEALRRQRDVDIEVVGDPAREVPEVDAKLVRFCLDRPCRLLTLDTNLAKAAAIAGVHVMNLHALAVSLRPPVSAGDLASVLLLKAGKEPGQAVGYLDDGTMVVVDNARKMISKTIDVVVTSVLQTTAGKMIFGRLWEEKHPNQDENPSDPNMAIHDSRSMGFRKATRELRQSTIIEEVDAPR